MTEESDTAFDCDYTRDIVCPYCGYRHPDSHEISWNEEGCGETECGRCDKSFHWSCSVSVSYCTETKEAPK